MKSLRILISLAMICILPLASILNLYGETLSQPTIRADEKTTQSSSPIAEKYDFGKEFTAPDIKLSAGGKEYAAKPYIHYPSGTITDQRTIVLNESGEYKVVYLADYEGGTLSESYSFVVDSELFSVSGQGSSVYLGTHRYMPDTKGVIASIRPGDMLVYNKPIDISSYTRNNKILTLNVLPETIGTVDAQKIIIRLTDIYDPENYITIEMKKVDENKLARGENTTFVVAYGNGQDSCGLEEGSHLNTGTVIVYNGKKYTIHKNNNYGAWISYSMPGAPRYQNINLPYYEEQYVGEQEFSISMDYTSGVVYAGSQLTLVNDLRSDVVFGSNFWNGFTTGEVYLSVSATGYKADALNLIIKEIAGQSTESMTENTYEDREAPSLKILWDDAYPDALVGHPYPLFEARSFDEYDREEKEVHASVYLNYGLENQVSIPVTDRKFIPEYETRYYIHYEAIDKSGNKSERTIAINAVKDMPKIAIDHFTDAEDTFDVGSNVTVRQITYKNIIGELHERITATLKSDPTVCYDVSDYAFVPLYAGEYEIRYDYGDFMFDGNHSYLITIHQTDKPLIDADISLLKYYIKGCSYILPEYSGYVFKNGKPVVTPLSIRITEGDRVVNIENNTYVPNYNGEIVISYFISNESETTEKKISARAVDVGYDSSLEMGKYFVGDNVSIQPEAKYIEYRFEENGAASLDFINTLASSNFAIRFGASEGLDGFTRIHLYLTDALDERIKIRFTYEKESSGFVKFYMNDGAATNYQTYFASNDNPIILEYNNRLKQVSPHPASYQRITETVYGEPFNGFSGSRIYLSFEIDGISGPSALRITNLNGQPFTKVKADIIEPKVYVINDVGDYDIDSIYTLGSACIADVLDPNIKAFVRVKDPDNEIVKSIDGVALDDTAPYDVEYHFKLEKFGIYQVYYEAVDSNGNAASYTYVINVVDKEIPTVKIINPVTEGKTGEAIEIASIGIKDNYSSRFDIYVCLIDPAGRICSMTKVEGETTIINRSFTTSTAGVYRICYQVMDQTGNTALASYSVTVH